MMRRKNGREEERREIEIRRKIRKERETVGSSQGGGKVEEEIREATEGSLPASCPPFSLFRRVPRPFPPGTKIKLVLLSCLLPIGICAPGSFPPHDV